MAAGREILVVWAGRRRGQGGGRGVWDELCGGYRRRIERFGPIREKAVRVGGRAEGSTRLEAEGKALLEALPQPVWTIALERLGKQRSSEDFAGWLAQRQLDWPHPLAFLLGSDLGLSAGVRETARESFSLGPMTLPHELARLVLYEQIYRGLSIGAGIKYHRQPL